MVERITLNLGLCTGHRVLVEVSLHNLQGIHETLTVRYIEHSSASLCHFCVAYHCPTCPVRPWCASLIVGEEMHKAQNHLLHAAYLDDCNNTTDERTKALKELSRLRRRVRTVMKRFDKGSE